MTQTKIKEDVCKILAEYILGSEELIKDDNTLGNDMGMDSFDIIDLVEKIENLYTIELPISTIGEMKKLTLQEVVRFIEKEVNNL